MIIGLVGYLTIRRTDTDAEVTAAQQDVRVPE